MYAEIRGKMSCDDVYGMMWPFVTKSKVKQDQTMRSRLPPSEVLLRYELYALFNRETLLELVMIFSLPQAMVGYLI